MEDMASIFAVYGGLFTSAFLAATMLPVVSEAVLAGLLVDRADQVWALVATATAGNVFGAMLNWLLGRFFSELRHKKWFPISEAHYDRAIGWYQRFGYWSLLLAWAPFIGDPLTVVAGVLRCHIVPFVIFVTVGKLARYIAIAAITLHWTGG